jgi:putative hydrolases of HD superfamily
VALASCQIRSSPDANSQSMDLNAQELHALNRLFSLSGRLKQIKRQGWIDRGVDQPESVSDHSFRLALMTLVIGGRYPGIDPARAVTLALVHDIPEAITGDITPFDQQLSDSDVDREALFFQLPDYSPQADREKTEAERQAMHDLTAELPEDLASMLVEAWEEYEAGETPEAKLVRQLDKLETWMQALEYQHLDPDLIIESFRQGVRRDVTDPGLVQLLEQLS